MWGRVYKASPSLATTMPEIFAQLQGDILPPLGNQSLV